MRLLRLEFFVEHILDVQIYNYDGFLWFRAIQCSKGFRCLELNYQTRVSARKQCLVSLLTKFSQILSLTR